MITIREYIDDQGRSPFANWFKRLNSTAAAKVTVALTRMETGSLSNVKSVGRGVLEYRVHFGPGYRVYFGRVGDTLVILLGGGTKQRQQQDIARAQTLWQQYRQRRREEM